MKRVTYTKADRDRIAEALNALPEKPPVEVLLSKTELIESLKNEIASLQKKGYTLVEIAAILKKSGMAVSVATLKLAASKARKPRRKTAELGEEASSTTLAGSDIAKPKPPDGSSDSSSNPIPTPIAEGKKRPVGEATNAIPAIDESPTVTKPQSTGHFVPKPDREL